MWFKAKWIDPLFSAINTVFPDRGHAQDGTIGDLAHQSGVSGHNPDDTPGVTAERQDADSRPEVRAADVDAGLNDAAGRSMWAVVSAVLAAPTDRDRLIYIIFDGWIWRAAAGWRRDPYAGTDKHRTHAHFSGHPDHDENDAPWTSILALKGDDVSEWTFVNQAPADEWKLSQGAPGYAGQARDTALAFAWQAAAEANAKAGLVLAKLDALSAVVQQLADHITAGGGSVDTAAILAGVDERLAALRAAQEAELRDAVADLGEGGAARVRADAE